jgi:tyrosyl-tRNA synthetase
VDSVKPWEDSRLLKRGVAEIISETELAALLREGRPLRLKMGFDPSAPDIHLGHVVGLRKLRQFQDAGHQLVLIVGDWTAQIGDPSGRSATRKMLTADEVKRNAETYMAQFFKVVDRSKTEVRWQSEWFGRFTLEDVIRLTSRFTVAQFLAREDFAKRFAADQPIAITELLYPLMQAYDSVVVKSDVEFGGTDQKFNLLVGRDLQGMVGQRPQQCFLVPILTGTDGAKKMSKSLGNYIGVAEPPTDMHGKAMSLPDSLIALYFELLTDVPDTELAEMRSTLERQSANPMGFKKRLALTLVAMFHGEAAAAEAARHFERTVQSKEAPEDVPRFTLPSAKELAGMKVSHIIAAAGLAESVSQARRLIEQGAVEVDGMRVETDGPAEALRAGGLVRAGKRKFVRLVAKG